MKPKLVCGNKYMHAHMDGILLKAIGNTFWKDTKGRFLGGNENELGFLGLSSYDDVIGRDARDLADSTQAQLYRQNDQSVMSTGNGMVFIEPGPRQKNIQQLYISYKAPLYNSKSKMIGTFGIGYQLGSLAPDEILNEIALFAGFQAQAIFKQSLLGFQQTQLDLSSRQMACLDLLTQGMIYKQIAASLGLSHRTVEHYFEALK